MSAATVALLLRAIAMVETGGNARAIGAHGERGQFQMTPAVASSCGGYGDREAEKHLQHLERLLMHQGIDPIPFNLALAWNAGPGAVTRAQAPESSYKYAVRVVNTFEAIKNERKN